MPQNSNITEQNKTIEIDIFQQKLRSAKEELEKCQLQRDLQSCSLCEHYLQCDTRRAYVNAVYNSMNKGETGGFEF